MRLNKRNTQFAIGLIVFAFALTTYAIPIGDKEFLAVMCELQIAATLALCVGIYKAHEKHKDKFLLLWLVMTAFCFYCLIRAGLMHWGQNLLQGHGSFIWGVLPWAFACGVAYSWNIMYNNYVDLTIESPKQTDEATPTTEAEVAVETTSKYPNLENLTILVHGKRLK